MNVSAADLLESIRVYAVVVGDVCKQFLLLNKTKCVWVGLWYAFTYQIWRIFSSRSALSTSSVCDRNSHEFNLIEFYFDICCFMFIWSYYIYVVHIKMNKILGKCLIYESTKIIISICLAGAQGSNRRYGNIYSSTTKRHIKKKKRCEKQFDDEKYTQTYPWFTLVPIAFGDAIRPLRFER